MNQKTISGYRVVIETKNGIAKGGRLRIQLEGGGYEDIVVEGYAEFAAFVGLLRTEKNLAWDGDGRILSTEPQPISTH
jgi:hypothetical protein